MGVWHRKNLRVILVHNAHAQDSLKLCAHETALFSEVTQQLPQRTLKSKVSLNIFLLHIYKETDKIKW